jgi:release factor glutamine methyltransferase
VSLPVAPPRTRRWSLFGPLVVEYDDRVLAPREWTLQQSRWATQLAAELPAGPILELCAGAGHIGLAAAVLSRRPLVQVEANPVAAEYAVRNAESAGWRRRVDIRVASVDNALAPGERFPVIIADPPYLPSDSVDQWPEDPPEAIDGGPDGLRLVRQCLAVAAAHVADGGVVLLQTAGSEQNDAIAEYLRTSSLGLVVADVWSHDDQRSVLLLRRP